MIPTFTASAVTPCEGVQSPVFVASAASVVELPQADNRNVAPSALASSVVLVLFLFESKPAITGSRHSFKVEIASCNFNARHSSTGRWDSHRDSISATCRNLSCFRISDDEESINTHME